jgi:hypothetical protein
MFSSNTETGIAATYQDGDGTIDLVIGDDTIVSSMLDTNIAIAGTLDIAGAFVFNEAGADVDFRVEGNGFQNLIFANGGTDRVGIGTATPSALLDVQGDVVVAGAIDVDGITNLDVVDIDGAVDMASTLSVAGNITQTTGDYLYTGGGNFDIKHNSASQNIVISTTPSGGSATSRMRITHDGKVGIGTDSPSQTLDVNGTLETNNLTIAGAQGSDGQLLTSTGSGVGWEDAPASGPSKGLAIVLGMIF